MSRRSFFSHRLLPSLTATVVVVGLVVGLPAVSSADQLEPRATAGNKNESDGDSSPIGEAAAEARKSKERVEVPEERTATKTIFVNPNGTISEEKALRPVWAKEADGEYAAIDLDLVKHDDRLAAKNSTRDVSLSDDGSGALGVLNLGAGRKISITSTTELGKPIQKGSQLTYPMAAEPSGQDTSSDPTATPEPSATSEPSAEAKPGVEGKSTAKAPSLVATVLDEGMTAHVRLENAPADAATFQFRIDAGDLDVDLKNGVLTFTDDKKLVATSSPLRMWDAQTDEAGQPSNVADVDAELEKSDGAHVLTLKPSEKFLTDPETKYPVTIDPDLTAAPQGDTYVFTGQSSSDLRGNEPILRVGSPNGTTRYVSYLSFAYKSYMGKPVTSASLSLWQYYAATCTAKKMHAFPTTADTTTGIHVGNLPPMTQDLRWNASNTGNSGATGCAAGAQTIDLTQMVNGWTNGELNSDTAGLNRQGLELYADNATDTSFDRRFCSANFNASLTYCNSASMTPKLVVTYAPELGTRGYYSMTDHQLNDRSSLSINNRNRNAVVQASDIKVNGRGLDLDVSRTYNSQSTYKGSVGKSWSLSVGPDIWLERKTNARFDYHGPGGTIYASFIRKSQSSQVNGQPNPDFFKFKSPRGDVGADLEQTTDGLTYTLKFRGNQNKYTFKHNSADTHAYLTKIEDRSDNKIEFAYSGGTSAGKPKLSTITDSSGRTYSVTYTGDVITKITSTETQVGTREWTYAYSGDYLTSYTNAEGKTTTYNYQSNPTLLTQIVNPATSAGNPTTNIGYAASSTPGVTTNEVGTVGYVLDSSTTYTYSWSRPDSRPARCDNKGDFWSIVTDPRGNDTTYCFEERNDAGDKNAKTWVYDPLGKAKSIEYTADNYASSFTNPMGQNVSGGSTVAAYSTSVPDQLSSITEPKSDPANGPGTEIKSSASYQHSNSPAGGAYLPSSMTDGGGNCNRYGYDSKGRTTDSYSGITTNGTNCDSTSSSERFHREYNDDGTVKESWDANATDDGSAPSSDSAKTIYTYWKSTDTDYVAGTSGQLKSLRKPGGSCDSANRRLCTSYTYDGAARVLTMTDGNGKITTYEYDKMDRTTKVDRDSSTTCNNLFPCDLTYSYDADGNLVTRTDNAGTAGFTFDRMNRMTRQTTPRQSLIGTFDAIDLTYDGVSNLLSYTQDAQGMSPDTVNYTYNAANRLTSVQDLSGTIDITTDDDGKTTRIKYPKPADGTGSGYQVAYDYLKNGRPKKLTAQTHAGATVFSVTYNYKVTIAGLTIDTPYQQSRVVTGSTSLASDTKYTYAKKRLTKATDDDTGSSAVDYEYTYDKMGNIKSAKSDSTTVYYGYNKAGELCWQGPNDESAADTDAPPTDCGTAPSGATTYNRDGAGNNLGTSSDPIAYTTNNQVTSIGGLSAEYLDLGNDLRRKYGTDNFVNGPLGTTIRQGGADRYYTRDPQGNILSQRDSSGLNVRNYTLDFNGSVLALTAPGSLRVGAYRYSPYGKTTTFAESGGTTAAQDNPFRYIGGYQDKDSSSNDSYYKMGARYYSPDGRFTQPDPISGNLSDPATLTAYNYAQGDPINQSDPSGYKPSGIFGLPPVVECAIADGATGLTAARFFGGGYLTFNTVGGFVGGACAADTGTVEGQIKAGFQGAFVQPFGGKIVKGFKNKLGDYL